MSHEPWWEWIWPSLATPASARYAVWQGFWAAVVCAVGVAVIVALNALRGLPDPGMPFGVGALLDAAAFAVIAVGLSRLSRLAAICGLALYLIEQVAAWSQFRPLNPVGIVLLVLAFTNAVRGTYAMPRVGSPCDARIEP